MDIAIVTGASSSLGLAISKRLIELGFRVYGLGGDYKDCSLQNVNFKPISCDLADPAAIETACRQIQEKEKGVYVIVNNAKFFGRNPFLKMDSEEMERILRINLLCPLVLTRFFAESLKSLQGFLIQLGAPYADSCSGGAAGAAAAGGLKWMGEQLFGELRHYGVKVCHLSPEPNRARDARRQVRRGARMEASIDPEAVAQAVEQILQSPFGNVVTELVLRPLRIDEPDQDPIVKLPYPEPQPIPYTVPREFIEAEEQLEEEDWQNKQEEKRKRRSAKKQGARKAASKKEPVESEPVKKEPARKQAPLREKGEEKPVAGEQKGRRRSRRKPRPPKREVGFHDGNQPREPQPDQSAQQKQPDKEPAKKRPAKKRPAKKIAKKVANKTAKKAPADKAPADKTPVKKAAKKAVKKAARKRSAKKAPKVADNGNNPAT